MPQRSSGDWLLMVDGAARGNPGPAGCGAFLRDPEGATRKKLCRYLGTTTNNVAEYEGLLMGLQSALDMGAKRVHIESDSELMVKQLNGLYRVRDEKLKALHRRALGLLEHSIATALRMSDASRIVSPTSLPIKALSVASNKRTAAVKRRDRS
jgi:ribonuclease HI